MKKKAKVSIIMALLLIASSFMVGAGMSTVPGNGEEETYSFGEVNKTVFNGEEWVKETNAEPGETVQFKIELTYFKTDDPNAEYAKNIVVTDNLHDSLLYTGDSSVEIDTNAPFTEEVSSDNKIVWWNFTSSNSDYWLEHGESIVIKFNATVGEDNTNINQVYVTAKEHCSTRDLEGESEATVIISEEPPEPKINVDKKVWDGSTWTDGPVTFYEGDEVTFYINITNIGNVVLNNIIFTDVVPDFLSESGTHSLNIGSLGPGEYAYGEFTLTVLEVNEVLTDDNYVNVTADEDVYDEDTATVTVKPHIIVTKEVWDRDKEEWVDEIDYVVKSENVKFKITTTYFGDQIMKCMKLKDFLSSSYCDNCLEFVEGSEQITYPTGSEYLFTDPEVIYSSEEIILKWGCNQLFNLQNGGTIEIILEANVTHYSDCIVTNTAEVWLKCSCFCEEWLYYGSDIAKVNCNSQPPRFTKEVSLDGESWYDEVETMQGETIYFKLEFEYNGDEVPNDIRFKDVLPCILLYVEDSANIEPTNVSDDLKTIYWNLTGEIEDGDTIVITFEAYVDGHTGTCPDCSIAYNKAWIEVYITEECPETSEKIFEDHDTVAIKAEPLIINYPPCDPTIGPDGQEAKTGEELTFHVKAQDPEGDDIYYQINWGDKTSEWLGPYTSGVEVEVKNTWDTDGTYTIKARAKDVYDSVSGWSDEITVTIIKDDEPPVPDLQAKIDSGLLTGGIKGNAIGVTVTNNMEQELTNVTFNGTINYGLILKKNVPVYSDNNTVKEGANSFAFPVVPGFLKGGIGPISINLTMTCDEGYELSGITGSGIILGRFIWIRNAETVTYEE